MSHSIVLEDLDTLLLFLLLFLLLLVLLSFCSLLNTMVLWYSNKNSIKKSWRFTMLEGSENKDIKALTALVDRLSLSIGWENSPERGSYTVS